MPRYRSAERVRSGPRLRRPERSNSGSLCEDGRKAEKVDEYVFSLAGDTPVDIVKAVTASEILDFISGIGIVPVVRTPSAESAIRSIEAIHRGGVRAAEVTMTVPGAIRAHEKLADRFGDSIMLGAGTVLDPETARACMLAGAQFFVTPTLKIA